MATPEAQAGGFAFGPWDVLEIVQRRWRWLALGLVVGLILGLALWWVLPRRYQATTIFMVEPQGVPESYVRNTITLSVEHRVNTLQQRVTSHANLNQLIDLIGVELLDPTGEQSREGLMSQIRENLAVTVKSDEKSPVAVVTLSYTAPRPEIVADVVREVANHFIAESRKDRAQQAASTASFLEQELDRIRGDLTEQEKRIREFRMAHLGALPDQLETNLRELDRLNQALAANLEAQDDVVHQVSLLRSQQGGGVASAPDSRAAALAEARAGLLEARLIYTDDHPTVLSLRAQIERLEQEIAEATAASADEAGAEVEWEDPLVRREIADLSFTLESRRKEESGLRERIAELQQRVDDAPRNEQELVQLTRDYETMQQTYRLILGNKHDASLAQNLETAQMAEQFKLLRPASTPSEPFWPDPLQVVPAGVAVGLGLAALLVLLAELRRPAFHSPESLARRLGLPIFASIPDLVRDKIYDGLEPPREFDWRLIVRGAPNSAAAEQYRGFVPHFLEKESCRVILVTSAQPGDGKSLTCLNLACTLATDLGRRVLVIDADMRRASLHRLANVSREPGLSDVLQGEVELNACARGVLHNLSLLPAGNPIENPLALLTDEAFFKLCEQACENYEVILIDSPPILPVIDAKILRRMADMVVFVVRAATTPSGGVTRSLRELRDVAGVVFNRVSAGSFKRYYYYDAYSHYEYADPDPPSAGERASKGNPESGVGGH